MHLSRTARAGTGFPRRCDHGRARARAQEASVTDGSAVLETIRTTRSLRRFRPDPIPDEVLRELLEAATSAPSGGNSQSWRFVVIRDPAMRRRVGALYKEGWDEYAPPGRLA